MDDAEVIILTGVSSISWGFLVAQTVKRLPAMWETRFDPWRRKWRPTLVFLPWENPMDGEAWWAKVHEVAKS